MLVTYKLGNYPENIDITTDKDVSASTALTVRFERPDKTTVDVTAAEIAGTGNEKKVRVTTAVSPGFNLNQAGPWRAEVVATFASEIWTSMHFSFYVQPRLTTPA